jgi:ABC-type transporter Mla subunit MlaD
MVNGQTGKVGGKAPVSPWKVALAVGIGLLVAGIIVYLLANYGGNGGDIDYYYYCL